MKIYLIKGSFSFLKVFPMFATVKIHSKQGLVMAHLVPTSYWEV